MPENRFVLVEKDSELVAGVTFACNVCGVDAVALSFYATKNSGAANGILVVSKFLGTVEICIKSLSLLPDLMKKSEAGKIYDLNFEYLPCFCPECKANYCLKEWRVWDEFDEGFYDCTRGVCPRGHSQMLGD